MSIFDKRGILINILLQVQTIAYLKSINYVLSLSTKYYVFEVYQLCSICFNLKYKIHNKNIMSIKFFS